MYLAQAGVGGETEGIWTNAPSGNFGGYTAGVARIEAGCAVPVADGLLSAGIQFPIDHRFGVPDTELIGGLVGTWALRKGAQEATRVHRVLAGV